MSLKGNVLAGLCGLALGPVAEALRQQIAAPGTQADEAFPLCVKEVERGLKIDESDLAKEGLVRVSVPAVCQHREALEKHVKENHSCYGKFSTMLQEKLVVFLQVRVCNGEKDPATIPTLNFDLDAGNRTGVEVEIFGEAEMDRQDKEGSGRGVEIAHEHLKLDGGEHDVKYSLDQLVAEAKSRAVSATAGKVGGDKDEFIIIDLDIQHDTDINLTLHSSKAGQDRTTEATQGIQSDVPSALGTPWISPQVLEGDEVPQSEETTPVVPTLEDPAVKDEKEELEKVKKDLEPMEPSDGGPILELHVPPAEPEEEEKVTVPQFEFSKARPGRRGSVYERVMALEEGEDWYQKEGVRDTPYLSKDYEGHIGYPKGGAARRSVFEVPTEGSQRRQSLFGGSYGVGHQQGSQRRQSLFGGSYGSSYHQGSQRRQSLFGGSYGSSYHQGFQQRQSSSGGSYGSTHQQGFQQRQSSFGGSYGSTHQQSAYKQQTTHRYSTFGSQESGVTTSHHVTKNTEDHSQQKKKYIVKYVDEITEPGPTPNSRETRTEVTQSFLMPSSKANTNRYYVGDEEDDDFEFGTED